MGPSTGVRLLVGLLLILVVDRIEGGVAAVELADATIVHLPVEVLPPGVREGERVVVRARRIRAREVRASGPGRGPGRDERAGEGRQEVRREQEGEP